MTDREPPRLALTLLERFAPDNAAMVGDLVEEFAQRPSAAWFWRQVIGAIWIATFRQTGEIRPLRLVDLPPADAAERSRRWIARVRPVNLTASPLHGVGGLGLVALSLLISLVVPGIWLALLASMLTGVFAGIVLIELRRRA